MADTTSRKDLPDWISDGEKFALVAIDTSIVPRSGLSLFRLSSEYWAGTDANLTIPDHWRAWLGTIRTEEIEGANLFILSKMTSRYPSVLDAENQLLTSRVSHFYNGLLLASSFAPAHEPTLLTGSYLDGQLDLRSHSKFEIPIQHPILHNTAVARDEIIEAHKFALELNRIVSEKLPCWRFFRTLTLYLQTRTVPDLLERLHQYCRCIEGLILPDAGQTARQFKSRTELFIGPAFHEMMGQMYDARSAVEHLHEHIYLDGYDREGRLKLLRHTVIAEYIVRKCLGRILNNASIFAHFQNVTTLSAFWKLLPADRAQIWGEVIDPMRALQKYNPRFISDQELGGIEIG